MTNVILILLLLFLLPLSSKGQTENLHSLTIDDGMQNGSVISILRGSDGFVYLGTFTGITRYDGVNVVNVPITGRSDKKYNIVYAIFEADPTHYYVGNQEGLWLFDPTTLATKRVFVEDIDCEVRAIRKTPKGDLLVATVGGLFRISSDGKLSRVRVYRSSRLTDTNLRDIAVVSKGYPSSLGNEGTVWAATSSGIVGVDLSGNTGGQLFQPPVLSRTGNDASATGDDNTAVRPRPNRIAITPGGDIFVGTLEHGLWKFNPHDKSFRFFTLAGSCINMLSVAANGNLLVASDLYGAVELNPITGKALVTYDDSGRPNSIQTRFSNPQVFYRDAAGIDWIGYKFFGLDHTYYNSDIFNVYGIPGIDDSSKLHVICSLADGKRTLVGTRNGLYVVDDERQEVAYFGEEQLGSRYVSTLTKAGDRYVVGTQTAGFTEIDAATLRVMNIDMPRQLCTSLVYQCKTDGMGNLWLCTNQGLVRYNPYRHMLDLFDNANSQLPDKEVFCIDFDLGGRGWISTRNGNCIYDPASEAISIKNLPNKFVALGQLRDIQRMEDGQMMFLPQRGFPVTADASVLNFTRLSFDVGEEAPNISFFRKHNGVCYFCTDNGFYTFRNDSLRCYGYLDGLTSMEFQRNFHISSDGRCLVSTNRGLLWARINRLNTANTLKTIPVLITQIQTDHWFNDTEVTAAVASRRITLSRSADGMSLRFSAMTFGKTSRLRYDYMLEGYDSQWNMVGANQTAFYPSLPFGTYKLKVRVKGNDSIAATYTIVVPMAYSTMALVAALVIGVVILLHVLWCRHYKREYIWIRLLPKREVVKYQGSRLSQKEAETIARRLTAYMEDSKPYLNPDLMMTDLALAIGVSNHTLSQIFTQHLRRNYYDFIAEYRIMEFKRMATADDNHKYTIMAIAEKCGFRSRTSFFAVFKKIMGCTPKEYLERMDKGK